MEPLETVCQKVRCLLEDAVRRNLAESILLSGIDTSILAALASKYIKLHAFTCAFEGAPAPDVKYAKLVANRLNLKHSIHFFDEDELFEVIPEVVRILKRFDPMEIRNAVTVYIALRFAREVGKECVMTGDASDELMAGYSWLQNLEKEELASRLRRMWRAMEFSSFPLSKGLGIEIKVPYLDPIFKSFAMNLDSRYKVRKVEGKIWGKWILRKSFEGLIPKEVAWRSKDPIEVGSGTTTLPMFFNNRISDVEFENKKIKYLEEDKVTIRDKEQLFYYEAYRSLIGIPHPKDPQGKTCPQCNSSVPQVSTFCRTCGAYPI